MYTCIYKHIQMLISHILGVDMRALISSLWPILPKLEWVYARSAGIDHLICHEMIRDKERIAITNAKGVFSHSVCVCMCVCVYVCKCASVHVCMCACVYVVTQVAGHVMLACRPRNTHTHILSKSVSHHIHTHIHVHTARR
jgi:hypothetical protein